MQLRLPPDLKAFVAKEAERNGSSQNSEIIRAVRERMERTTAETD
jgi:predicted HicB family RNase H-like nuclease